MSQITTYFFVGAISALLDISCIYFLNEIGNFFAISFGYFIGILVNYTMHAMITFKSGISINTFLKYVLLVAINYVFTVAIVLTMVQFGFPIIAGKIFALIVVALISFLSLKIWIFN